MCFVYICSQKPAFESACILARGLLNGRLHMLKDALTNERLNLIAAHKVCCVALQVHDSRVRDQLACTPSHVN